MQKASGEGGYRGVIVHLLHEGVDVPLKIRKKFGKRDERYERHV